MLCFSLELETCLKISFNYLFFYFPIFVLIAAYMTLITIVKRQKKPKCSSTDNWINKLRYSHTIEYYAAIKETGINTHNN